jgi:hypothetical protein
MTLSFYSCNSLSESESRNLWITYQQLKVANENFVKENDHWNQRIEKCVMENGNRPFEVTFISKSDSLQLFVDSIAIELSDIESKCYSNNSLYSVKINEEVLLPNNSYKLLKQCLAKGKDLKSFRLPSDTGFQIWSNDHAKLYNVPLKLIYALIGIENIKMEIYLAQQNILNEYLGFLNENNSVLSYDYITNAIEGKEKCVSIGDTFKASIFPILINKTKTFKPIITIEIDGFPIPVDSNNLGHYSVIAQSDTFDSKGLAQKKFTGKIIIGKLKKATILDINGTYYVKKNK